MVERGACSLGSARNGKALFAAFVAAVSMLGGCEDCPDRSVRATVEPRGAARLKESVHIVTFAEEVFLEPSPARESDIRVRVASPGGRRVGIWLGGTHPPEGFLRAVRVLDEHRIELMLSFGDDAPQGLYRISVDANSAGACPGPSTVVELDVK